MPINNYFSILLLGSFLTATIACSEEKNKAETLEENTFVFEEKESAAAQLAKLKAEGYETFEFIDEEAGDTIIMQQYFMAFLMRGNDTTQSEAELTALQNAHMAHLSRMYEEGFADISGPFGDNGEMRGITIYNVPTIEIADSLANLDPMVQAGRLQIEIKPWWAGKGYPLR